MADGMHDHTADGVILGIRVFRPEFFIEFFNRGDAQNMVGTIIGFGDFLLIIVIIVVFVFNFTDNELQDILNGNKT